MASPTICSPLLCSSYRAEFKLLMIDKSFLGSSGMVLKFCISPGLNVKLLLVLFYLMYNLVDWILERTCCLSYPKKIVLGLNFYKLQIKLDIELKLQKSLPKLMMLLTQRVDSSLSITALSSVCNCLRKETFHALVLIHLCKSPFASYDLLPTLFSLSHG